MMADSSNLTRFQETPVKLNVQHVLRSISSVPSLRHMLWGDSPAHAARNFCFTLTSQLIQMKHISQLTIHIALSPRYLHTKIYHYRAYAYIVHGMIIMMCAHPLLSALSTRLSGRGLPPSREKLWLAHLSPLSCLPAAPASQITLRKNLALCGERQAT